MLVEMSGIQPKLPAGELPSESNGPDLAFLVAASRETSNWPYAVISPPGVKNVSDLPGLCSRNVWPLLSSHPVLTGVRPERAVASAAVALAWAALASA